MEIEIDPDVKDPTVYSKIMEELDILLEKKLGESVSTEHISEAENIPEAGATNPAVKFREGMQLLLGKDLLIKSIEKGSIKVFVQCLSQEALEELRELQGSGKLTKLIERELLVRTLEEHGLQEVGWKITVKEETRTKTRPSEYLVFVVVICQFILV